MIREVVSLIAAINMALAHPPVPAAPAPTIVSTVASSNAVSVAPPDVRSESAFLIDTKRGEILFEKRADMVRPIASLTKLMTATVLLKRPLSWLSPVRFAAEDERGGDRSLLIPGEEITIKDAWHLMLVASSNDATALLARTVSGSEDQFVKAMNEAASRFSFKHTVFVEPTGFEAHNVSTAREAAALTSLALNIPEVRGALVSKEYVFTPAGKDARAVRSTNWLLRSFRAPGVRIVGGKTGYIEESGYNLVFAAANDKRELIGVVLGSASNEERFEDMSALMRWGFRESGPALGG